MTTTISRNILVRISCQAFVAALIAAAPKAATAEVAERNYDNDIGVYVIYCRATKKSYIGSTQRLESRLSTHKTMLQGGSHYNVELQEDFKKYGESAFVFSVFERIEEKTEAQRLEAEMLGEYAAKGILYNHVGKRLRNKDYTKARWFKKKLPERPKLTPAMALNNNRRAN